MKNQPREIERYGAMFPASHSDLQIEMDCIKWGGSWADGKCGLGLFHHYKQMQMLIWPELDHHRWSDLFLKTILDNKVTCVLGAASTGKTHSSAKYALCDYFCFPNETTIIVSSTDLRGLELRVWGELKSLLTRAQELHPNLPGLALESKHSITTEPEDPDAARDLRNGIICFKEGTLVDTPSGPRRIESILPGDAVINACGIGKVKNTQRRISKELLRVRISDGTAIDCTPEHPFFTLRGWVKAVDLETFDRVLYAHETVRYLQSTNRTWVSESEALFGSLSRSDASKAMRFLPQVFSAHEAEAEQSFTEGKILLNGLFESLGVEKSLPSTARQSQMRKLWKDDEYGSSESTVLFGVLSESSSGEIMRRMWENVLFHTPFKDQTTESVLRTILQMEMGEQTERTESFEANQIRDHALSGVSKFKDSSQSLYGPHCFKWNPSLLRTRFGFSENQAWYRDRRAHSCATIKDQIQQKAHGRLGETWVESIEILQSPNGKGIFKSDNGYPVYNLEVSGHPSYSVNGVIVHNCIPCLSSNNQWQGLGRYSGLKNKRVRMIADEAQFMRDGFLQSVSNLDKNRDFKAVFLGNPIDPFDQLGIAAEPKEGGWDKHVEPTKTTLWSTKFYNGIALNLVGTDSPNFDLPENQPTRYPYLISREAMRNTEETYGKDSLQYYSQCIGVMKTGIVGRRVMSLEICRQFQAFEEPIWGTDVNRTKIYAVDAAYGFIGGDRCVGGWMEFGKDKDGKLILAMHPPVIIPVSIRLGIPEDQIAKFVMEDCERNNIPPHHVFFDATGRGSLGTSFARIWSPSVNPIEFGGAASPRPMGKDMMILDQKTKQKRLKRCDEHYSKFVTELWFTVRYMVEGGQVRGMSMDVAREFALREWKLIKSGKIEIESKDETKKRMGRSPDLADWAATCCEGARRLGFQIAKLANADQPDRQNDFLRELQRKSYELRQRKELKAA